MTAAPVSGPPNGLQWNGVFNVIQSKMEIDEWANSQMFTVGSIVAIRHRRTAYTTCNLWSFFFVLVSFANLNAILLSFLPFRLKIDPDRSSLDLILCLTEWWCMSVVRACVYVYKLVIMLEDIENSLRNVKWRHVSRICFSIKLVSIFYLAFSLSVASNNSATFYLWILHTLIEFLSQVSAIRRKLRRISFNMVASNPTNPRLIG